MEIEGGVSVWRLRVEFQCEIEAGVSVWRLRAEFQCGD